MERCSQPPPDDFPRLWGVEDKLGLYIPKQKGVLALEGELDISPRRYLSGKLKSLYRLGTGWHTFDNMYVWIQTTYLTSILQVKVGD